MKRFTPLLCLAFLVACSQEPKSDLKTDKAKLSYAIGQEIGQNLKSQQIDVDPSALAMSIADVVAGRKSALNEDDLKKVQKGFQDTRNQKSQAGKLIKIKL